MDAFSDDMTQLPNDAIKNVLTELLNAEFPQKEYILNIESGSEKGDNYIGIVYRATAVRKSRNNNDEDKMLSVIIKVAPRNQVRRRQFFARPSFIREALVYDDLLPTLMEFQSKKNIKPSENNFHEFAKCYRTITDDMNEAIFMEDLRVEGYEMFNRFNLLTSSHVNIVVRILAKLHAISYAFKDQCLEKFKKFQMIDDVFLSRASDDQLLAYFEESKRIALTTLKAGDDQFYIDRFNDFLKSSSFFNLLMNTVNGSKAEPHAVFCHGDCWNNNILFKNKNGKPLDARFVDWQIARYSSPVCDLMYYIFISTSKEYRDKHYFQMLDVYYAELCAHIKRLGSNPQNMLPREALDEQLKEFGAFGLLMSMMILPIITNKAEDVPDLDNLSEEVEADKTKVNNAGGFLHSRNKNVYSKIMRDIIIDNINLDYI